MKYRVNFGQGQVSHTFKSQSEAQRYIDACRQHGSDPHVSSYFVQFWDPDGGWFSVRRSKKARDA
jgi:hypothetical protein